MAVATLNHFAWLVAGTATADAATGRFTISPNVQYTQAGTYTYTLSEVNDNRAGITYDTNVHTIQVTIEEKSVSLLGVTFKSYNVSSVTLDGSESGGCRFSWVVMVFVKASPGMVRV